MMETAKRRNVATNVVMPVVYKEKLQLLSRKTRINQSEYLREAVADLLEKYKEVFEEAERVEARP